MTPEQFCYWLQGQFERDEARGEETKFSPAEIKMIREHLQLVFTKVTPEPARVAPGGPESTPVRIDPLPYRPSEMFPSNPFGWPNVPYPGWDIICSNAEAPSVTVSPEIPLCLSGSGPALSS